MVKNNNLKIVLLILFSLFFASCAHMLPEPKFDTPYAIYPKYRIDDKIKKIVILGTGPSANDISLALMDIFKDSSNIKIVEPGNLKSILRGKIIEYGTGLTSEESQLISQMLQVDHILLFAEKISPYNDYMYGGRIYNQINYKIINTLSGEIILHESSNYGAIVPDPRSYGYSMQHELSTSEISMLRKRNLTIMSFKLRFALGSNKIGILAMEDTDTIIKALMIDSPAERAGLQMGDKILEINSKKINSPIDYGKCLEDLNPKQGDVLQFKIKRSEKILDLEVKLPYFPFSPSEQESIKPIKQEPSISQPTL